MSTTYESDTLVMGQSLDLDTLSPLIPVDVADKPFSFDTDPNDIWISDRFDDASLDALVNDLQIFDVSGNPLPDADLDKKRRGIRNFLARHGGSRVAVLLGYLPSNIDGNDFYDNNNPLNYDEGFFVFGRIHSPQVYGFSAQVDVTQSQRDKAHFRIKVPFFNSSIKHDLTYSLNQSLQINHLAKDLVIRATYRVVRWQDESGNHFYTTELHNRSRFISTENAVNPYNTATGYDEMGLLPGVVCPIKPGEYPPNDGPKITLEQNDTFTMDLILPYIKSLRLPGFEFSAEATTLEQVEIRYSLLNQFAYRLYDVMDSESDRRFEHYWSYR